MVSHHRLAVDLHLGPCRKLREKHPCNVEHDSDDLAGVLGSLVFVAETDAVSSDQWKHAGLQKSVTDLF